MIIVYSYHAEMRRKQKGLNKLEVEHILQYAPTIRTSFSGKKIAEDFIRNKLVSVVFIRKENYIKIVTIM